MTSKPEEDNLEQTIIQTVKEKKPQTVQELTGLVNQKLQIPEKEIVNSILRLQSKGRISFTDQAPPAAADFTAYLKTNQALWYWATLGTAIATLAVVFLIPENLYPWVYIRYVLGTIFVLWLPGYTFIKALFPRELPFARGLAHSFETSQKNLDTIERIALSLGMSLALVPIIGLLLNYTPWGIRLTPIVLSLLAVTIVFATAGIIREHQTTTKTEN